MAIGTTTETGSNHPEKSEATHSQAVISQQIQK
jgi:hypothetical protein